MTCVLSIAVSARGVAVQPHEVHACLSNYPSSVSSTWGIAPRFQCGLGCFWPPRMISVGAELQPEFSGTTMSDSPPCRDWSAPLHATHRLSNQTGICTYRDHSATGKVYHNHAVQVRFRGAGSCAPVHSRKPPCRGHLAATTVAFKLFWCDWFCGKPGISHKYPAYPPLSGVKSRDCVPRAFCSG